MSNVTALPPPTAPNPRETALLAVRIAALRISGASMLPADLPKQNETQIAMLAHRLGTIQTMAEQLLQAVAALAPAKAAENTNA